MILVECIIIICHCNHENSHDTDIVWHCAAIYGILLLQVGMFDIIILIVIIITTRLVKAPSWSGSLKNGAWGSYFREDKVAIIHTI